MKSVIMFVIKVKKREIHKDFYPIYVQNVIEVTDVFNNAEPVSAQALNNKCRVESATCGLNIAVFSKLCKAQ